VYICTCAVIVDCIFDHCDSSQYIRELIRSYQPPYLDDVRYATEVDVDFVRKSVRAIGRCAIKVEQAAERCVSTLLDLIQTKVNYVVQEAVIVIKVRLFSR